MNKAKIFLITIAMLVSSACSFTITKTEITIRESDNVSIENLQEQKSDTTSDTSAQLGEL